MNKRAIATARDADLRHSEAAMQRAAQRAREVAHQTGTAVVISRGGVIQQVDFSPAPPEHLQASSKSVLSDGSKS